MNITYRLNPSYPQSPPPQPLSRAKHNSAHCCVLPFHRSHNNWSKITHSGRKARASWPMTYAGQTTPVRPASGVTIQVNNDSETLHVAVWYSALSKLNNNGILVLEGICVVQWQSIWVQTKMLQVYIPLDIIFLQKFPNWQNTAKPLKVPVAKRCGAIWCEKKNL